VLETGLERALRLAESMDSRGYGRARAGASDHLAVGLGLVGLLGLSGAVLALVGQSGGAAAVLAGVGVASLVGAVVVSGRAAPTRYRRRALGAIDAAVMATVVAVPVALGVCAVVGVDDLTWDPAVLPLTAPGLPVLPALVLAGLAVPALVRPLPPETGRAASPARTTAARVPEPATEAASR
jgi:energy-coupling factor transport system permease protein